MSKLFKLCFMFVFFMIFYVVGYAGMVILHNVFSQPETVSETSLEMLSQWYSEQR